MKRVNSTLRFLMAIALLFASVVSFGQSLTVAGTVYDQGTNEVMLGVTVLVPATGTGTITGMKGDFSIQVQKGEELSFSFIGYKTQTVQVASDEKIEVYLVPDVELLGEVIAIGYGVQKKEDKTGAVFSVESDELQTVAVQDPIEALQGKVTGVTIRKGGSDPNAGFDVKIRGASGLLSGTSPLYVVDGVVGVDPTTIAAEDIASVNILKDASSAAIYGSRGSNGVIMITTKRGKSGEAKIEYNGYVTMDNVSSSARLDLMSADEYRAYATSKGMDIRDMGENTDWQDVIYRTGITQNHNVAISGGNENSSFRASISHNDMEGLVETSAKQRTIMRMNAETKTLNDRVKLIMNLANTIEHNDYVNYGSPGADGSLFQAFQRNPTIPVMNEDGSYYQDPTPPVNNYSNPAAILNDIQNQRDAKRLLANVKAEIDIIEGLKLTVNGAYNRNDEESFYFEPKSNGPLNGDGRGSRSYNNNSSKLLETYASYNKDFGRHNVQAVGGYSRETFEWDGFSAQGINPASDYAQANALQMLAKVTPGDISSSKGESKLISGFGRFVYNYDSKYYLTATLRRDGSSKFGANNEYGWFPSASLAWNIKRESFLANNDYVSQAKLRLGYGTTGNQEIATYADVAFWGVSNYTYDPETNEYEVNFSPQQNPNPDLKWEVTTEVNLGLDFGLLDNRINGTVEYFNKTTSDMVYNYKVSVPPNLVGTTLANGGEFSIKGLEVLLSGFIFDTDDFKWNTSVTFSHVKAIVESLQPANTSFQPQETVYEGYLQEPLGYGVSTQVLMEGHEQGTFFGPHFLGFRKSDGAMLYERKDGTPVTYDAISPADYQILGQAQPDFELGWSHSITFLKRWDASMTFRGMFGHDILNATEMVFGNPNYFPTRNILNSAPDNEMINGPSYFSDYFLEKGDFFRLENITLGYKFDTSSLTWLAKARVFAAANNLFTLTNYKGIDPGRTGIDIFNTYPKSTSFSIGLNATF